MDPTLHNSWNAETPLLRIVVCLMAGIFVGDNVVLSLPLLPLFVGLVVVALLSWRWAQVQSVLIALCFGVLGVLLINRQKVLLKVSWPQGESGYEALVLSEPIEKPKTIAVDLVLTESGRKIKAYIHKDERSRDLHVGDGLRFRSVIKENDDWQSGKFDYRRYLEVHGFAGNTYIRSQNWQKADITLRSLSRLERSRIFFLKQRSCLLKRFKSQGLDGDEYAIVAAMALGDKTALSHELKDVYAETGASHILALSGLHLGIIYVLLTLFIARRRWRTLAQVLTVICIWAFVFLVGMSVSVVRSAIMLTIYALLSLGHRDRMSVNVLAFTAIVMLCWNPLSLFDIGFQLSFMSVFSILLFTPLFMQCSTLFIPSGTQNYLAKSVRATILDRISSWIWGMAAVSLAAQIGVAPLIAYYFGRFSPCFLLTNFIVVPAATLILYLSLVILLVPSLSFLLIYTVGALNAIMIHIDSLPMCSIDGLHPSVVQVVFVYVVIGAAYLILKRYKAHLK